MKIFMFVNYTPLDKSLGITKKINSEIVALRNLGHKVVYTTYTNEGICIHNNNDEVVFSRKYLLTKSVFVRIARYFYLIKSAQDYLNKTHRHFDVCYGRLLAPSSNYLKLLRGFKKNGTMVVLEAHAYFPGIRFKSMKGKYVSFMLKKNGPKLKDCVDRILTEGHIDDFYGIKDVREARIGVDTNIITPHKYIGSTEVLNLISVANETTYHAYDRVIKSLYVYYKNEDNPHTILLHLVGTVSDSTKRLIEQLGLNEKVFLYGKQYGEKLDQIYNQCNIGLGPFGQHRIGGKKDTGLKTKEYFAKGLPYIFSGEEPSVPRDYPYIMQFPSDESVINFKRVLAFYSSFSNNPGVVEDMRAFAKEHYSWDSIMEEALSELV